MSPAEFDLSNGFVNAIERAGRSVVTVNEGGRAGVSGTVWRDGLVVTTEHTIRGQRELTIKLPNGTSSTATVVGADPNTDVALLRLQDSLAATNEFANPTKIRVGQFVLVIGRRRAKGLVASHGIVSAVGGEWRTWRGGRIDQSFRLDVLPFSGFSGGPLVDVQGRIIGINTSGLHRSVMTVPVTTVNRIVDQLLAKGRIPRGFLGIALQPVRLPSSHSGANCGLLVTMTEPGGPAEKAGFIIGDIVTTVTGKPVTDLTDLQATLDPEQVGRKIQIRVLRAGQAHDLSLTVGEHPE